VVRIANVFGTRAFVSVAFNDIHPSVAWLKFAALAERARLATLELWN
jgi:hypothetical protein